jgi:acetyl-CoA acetyltransferase
MDGLLIFRALNSTQKHPDDVVITLAIRTPLTKGRKGGFKDTTVDGIAYKLLVEVVKKMNMDPALVEDICLGNVSFFARRALAPLEMV